MVKRFGLLPVVIIILLMLLAFHYVSYGTMKGTKYCVVPKESFSFDTTFASANTEAGFALAHPFIYHRIISDHGYCVSM